MHRGPVHSVYSKGLESLITILFAFLRRILEESAKGDMAGLEYENQIFLDAFRDDGLVILAK